MTSRPPHVTRAQGIDEWKTPSPLRKIERQGESNLVDGIADWTTPSNPRRNNWRNKGEVKSKKVSNKYDLLDNVAAEIDEVDDEKKGREKGAKSGKESSVCARSSQTHTLPRVYLTARRARGRASLSRPSLSVTSARRPAAPRRRPRTRRSPPACAGHPLNRSSDPF